MEQNKNSLKNLAIVFLLTIVAGMALASPASATGFISGLTKYNNGSLAGGVLVIATNNTNPNQNFTATSLTGGSLGSYVINVPSVWLPGNFTVTAKLTGFIASSVGVSQVTDGNTTVAQDLVLTEILFPTTKIDAVSQNPIPADGVSTTVITATVYDQHGNPLVNGDTHNSTSPLATVNFYLRNGTLNAATGYNGTLSGSSLGVPIDANGQASVTLTSGMTPGSVTVFNNVTNVTNMNGKEVNATTSITYTALQGQIHGTVVSSEGLKLPNTTVNAYRLLWTQNMTTGIWTKTFEFIKNATTDSTGDYVLPFLPLKFDQINVSGTNITNIYQYSAETLSNATPDNSPPPLVTNSTGLLTNWILVTASLTPFNNGSAENFLIVDTTDTMDIVLTSGQPDQLYVSVDGSIHKVLDTPNKMADGISTWTVTAQLMKSGVNFAIPGQVITFVVDDSTVAGLSTATAATDASGKATVTLTSTIKPGTVQVTGSFVTRDNVLLTDYDFAKSVGAAQLSGIVTNENQVQLPNAVVTLSLFNGTSFVPALDINGNLLGSRTTPNTGQTAYTFTQVPSGTYKVVATLGNQSGFAYPVNLTTGTSTANVVIIGGVVQNGLIAGVVTNASSGLPISGATVTAGSISAASNTNGNYSISIAPGTYTVTANASGYNSNTATVTVLSGATATANIALTPGTTNIVRTYLACGATAADRKTGVTNAVNDYLFNHILSKTDITAIVNEYLFPTC